MTGITPLIVTKRFRGLNEKPQPTLAEYYGLQLKKATAWCWSQPEWPSVVCVFVPEDTASNGGLNNA